MLMAFSLCGKRIYAPSIVNKQQKQNYFCPYCKERVYLRQVKNKIAHFAHYKKCNHEKMYDRESLEHLTGKLLLFNWLQSTYKQVKLEYYLADINQRPDVFVQTEHAQIAFEFQCSPISYQQLKKRTTSYLQNDYYVIWLMGSTHYLKQTMQFCYGKKELVNYHLNIKNKMITKRSYQAWQSKKIIHYKLNESTVFDVFQKSILENIKMIAPKRFNYFMTQQLKRYLYQQNWHKIVLPQSLFYYKYQYPGMRSYTSLYLILLYCLIYTYKEISLIMIFRYTQLWLKEKLLKVHLMPLIQQLNWLKWCVLNHVELLEHLNLVFIKENVVKLLL